MARHDNAMRIHLATYAAAVLGLVAIAVAADGMRHTGTPSIHTLLEAVAAVVALVVGAIAIVRYQSRNDLPYLFIGTGFLGAGILDAFHAWSSSVYAYNLFPSSLGGLTIWGWTAGRIFLGALLVLSGWAWWWSEPEHEAAPPTKARNVYLVSGSIILALYLLFLFVALPAPVYLDWAVPRPYELVPALLFVAALVGFFAMGRWRAEPAEHWLVLSLLVALAIQTLLMPFSTRLWDTRMDIAHVLKIVSYGFALVGLLLNVQILQHTIVREERRLSETNSRLQEEIVRRSAAEARSAQESDLLQSVFDSIGDAVLVANAAGRMTRSNQSALALTGRSITSLPATAWAEHYGLYRPDRRTPLGPTEMPLARAARGESFDNQTVFLRNDARPEGVHLSVSGRPVHGPDGRLHGGVIVMRDVTSEHEIQEQLRRYTAELERRNQDLEDFATIVSHDLKEPLRKVLAFGERLENKLGPDLEPDASDHLRRMRQAAERMRALIDDLLAYTRLNDLKSLEEVDLAEVVGRAVQDLEERIQETGGRVTIGPLCRLHCDPVQMYQVFMNLIGNSLKYHRTGVPPDIRVMGKTSGATCTVTIQDNGIGFEMKYADRIFRPFHRLHTRSQYEGSGIGLAIVRKVVEQHGGSVAVDSVPGEGSRFDLILPLEHPELEVRSHVP